MTPEIAEELGKYFLKKAHEKRNKDSGNNGGDDDDDDNDDDDDDDDIDLNIKRNISNDDSITLRILKN